MDNSLLVSLSHQLAAYRSMDVIANNIANVSTPGFKRETAKFEEYITHVAPPEGQDRHASRLASSKMPASAATSARAISRTPERRSISPSMATAISFTVQTPTGMRYTRDGHFTLDASGQVVNSDGYPLQGDGGAITITPDDGNVQVGADGTISSTVRTGQIGKLQVVSFADEQARLLVKGRRSNLYFDAHRRPPRRRPAPPSARACWNPPTSSRCWRSAI